MKPIEIPPGRAELVYQAIADEISAGALPAGTHLVQEQLAARLGVSRQPVQQAMALLKADGLVEQAPGRGLRVTTLNLDLMQRHYEIRAALDGLAARLAAERVRQSETVRQKIAAQGRKIMTPALSTIGSMDIKRLVALDAEFHNFVYESSGNGLIAATGNANLDGTMAIEAVSSLNTVGDISRTIITAASFEGAFDEEPAAGDHLGYGVFYQGGGLNGEQTQYSVDLFQAQYGDVNGDGEVDIFDILHIKVGEHGFGKPGPADWTDGDMVGQGLDQPPDGIVDIYDILKIKLTGAFGQGPYAAVPGDAVMQSVPEPSSFLLAAIGAAGLIAAALGRRRISAL